MPEAPETRATLLVRIRDAGDIEAWQQFVDLYGPVIYGWCRKRGLQDADACDLTQEVLQAVSAGAGRLEYDPQRGTFRAWLFTITRRKLHDFLKKGCRQPQANGEAAALLAIAEDRQAEADWERDYQSQLFAIACSRVQQRVDERTWRAFSLTAIDGRSGQETAEVLGMSIGAVYVAKTRVLARLKEQVERLRDDE